VLAAALAAGADAKKKGPPCFSTTFVVGSSGHERLSLMTTSEGGKTRAKRGIRRSRAAG